MLSFILVNPARPANVGAAARAMKTMGFKQLILVGSDIHLDEEAQWVAHGAQDILKSATCYPDLASLKQDFDLLIGTTARERGSARRYLSPPELSSQLSKQSGRCGLVFGCEASGLSNDQLALCDLYSYIPLASPYPSLNLGQAVMVYSYALSQLKSRIGLDDDVPDTKQIQYLKNRAAEFLAPYSNAKTEKLSEWLMESLARLSDRDLRMAHQLINLLASNGNEYGRNADHKP